MTIDDDKIGTLAAIHPLLPEKLRMDEEEKTRAGQTYTLFYEKTYGGGSTDSYESSVKAVNDEEAIAHAHEKLQMKDMMARWDTDITDALLIGPTGQKLLIPDYSKQLREKK